MRYLSLFSGIEPASVAWEPLGFEAVAFAEIDKFASSLLAKKYPKIPNLGDVTKITEQQIKDLGEIDLIVFGSPCQDLSIAGKRAGLEGGRSGLFRTAINIIQWARKHCGLRFALWENVPGAFSSNQGRDFATVVSLLAGIDHLEPPKNGWGREGAAVGDAGMLEWSVLDAQYFGVAQRRERVFVVVDFGDWASRPPILLEPESLRGNPPARRTERKGIATNASAGTGSECYRLISFGQYKTDSIASTLRARDGRDATDLITECYCIAGNWIGRKPENGGNGVAAYQDVSYTLTSTDRHAGAYSFDSLASNSMKSTKDTSNQCPSKNQGGMAVLAFDCKSADHMPKPTEEFTQTLRSMNGEKPNGGGHIAVLTHEQNKYQVRRLTPLECERLMGFPDNYTDILSTTQRYRALGNSMAVPVMRWIGIQLKKYAN